MYCEDVCKTWSCIAEYRRRMEGDRQLYWQRSQLYCIPDPRRKNSTASSPTTTARMKLQQNSTKKSLLGLYATVLKVFSLGSNNVKDKEKAEAVVNNIINPIKAGRNAVMPRK